MGTDRRRAWMMAFAPLLAWGLMLAGLSVLPLCLTPCTRGVDQHWAEETTQVRVMVVSSALTTWDGSAEFPPTALEPGNELNRGIEWAFVALHLKGLTVRFDLPDGAIGNTDGDRPNGAPDPGGAREE